MEDTKQIQKDDECFNMICDNGDNLENEPKRQKQTYSYEYYLQNKYNHILSKCDFLKRKDIKSKEQETILEKEEKRIQSEQTYLKIQELRIEAERESFNNKENIFGTNTSKGIIKYLSKSTEHHFSVQHKETKDKTIQRKESTEHYDKTIVPENVTTKNAVINMIRYTDFEIPTSPKSKEGEVDRRKDPLETNDRNEKSRQPQDKWTRKPVGKTSNKTKNVLDMDEVIGKSLLELHMESLIKELTNHSIILFTEDELKLHECKLPTVQVENTQKRKAETFGCSRNISYNISDVIKRIERLNQYSMALLKNLSRLSPYNHTEFSKITSNTFRLISKILQLTGEQIGKNEDNSVPGRGSNTLCFSAKLLERIMDMFIQLPKFHSVKNMTQNLIKGILKLLKHTLLFIEKILNIWTYPPRDIEDLYSSTCTTKLFQSQEKSYEEQQDVSTITKLMLEIVRTDAEIKTYNKTRKIQQTNVHDQGQVHKSSFVPRKRVRYDLGDDTTEEEEKTKETKELQREDCVLIIQNMENNLKRKFQMKIHFCNDDKLPTLFENHRKHHKINTNTDIDRPCFDVLPGVHHDMPLLSTIYPSKESTLIKNDCKFENVHVRFGTNLAESSGKSSKCTLLHTDSECDVSENILQKNVCITTTKSGLKSPTATSLDSFSVGSPSKKKLLILNCTTNNEDTTILTQNQLVLHTKHKPDILQTFNQNNKIKQEKKENKFKYASYILSFHKDKAKIGTVHFRSNIHDTNYKII
jgi:hypothetical protein